MTDKTYEDIIKMMPKIKEMSTKPDVGSVTRFCFNKILAMSDEEIAENLSDINEMFRSIPLQNTEVMRKKYGFDLGRRYFDEKAHEV